MKEQLTTIADNGYWHNRADGLRRADHHIGVVWNGAGETARKRAKKQLISEYRHGREPFDVVIESNGHEIHIKELQKTKREKQIILDRISAVKGLVESFGYQPSQKYDLNRSHLLKPGRIKIFSGGDMTDGFFDPLGQCETTERSPSDVECARNIGHEELHRESPTIWQLQETIALYRHGLKTIDQDGEVHMGKFDEALNADLNYYLFKTTIQNNPLYEEELNLVRKIRPWIKEIISKQAVGEVILSENIFLEDIYTIRGAKKVSETLGSSKSKDYKIAYLADVIENPRDDCKLITFERSEEVKYFTETAYKIIDAAKLKGKMIFPNEIINWFSWVKFAPNEKFFEKRDALKARIDGIMGEGFFEGIR